MTKQFDLLALHDHIPRDFLAALGIVALLGEKGLNPSLSWCPDSGHPRIHLDTDLGEEQIWGDVLLDALSHLRSQEPQVFRLGKIEGNSKGGIDDESIPGLFANHAGKDTLVGRLIAALTAQLRGKSGRRSWLMIEVANRSVLSGVDQALAKLQKERERATAKGKPFSLAPTLSAETPKVEVSNTPRWNPEEAQLAAYCSHEPKDNKIHDYPALNVLAVLGLRFYPTFDVGEGRCTLGTSRFDRKLCFTWPVWHAPLGEDGIASLVGHPAIHLDRPDLDTLATIGVHQVWRSQRYSPDGNNEYFSVAFTPS